MRRCPLSSGWSTIGTGSSAELEVAAAFEQPPPRIAITMIDREQVLHVARLARLELTDDEVRRMSAELSDVLDHIEKIGELDLDGVPPTAHVVEVSNALRADEVQPSLARDVAFEQAPAVADGGFLVPSPQAG